MQLLQTATFRNFIFLIVIFLASGCKSKPTAETTPAEDPKYSAWVESIRYYKKHFSLDNEFTKKVNNTGNGSELLYGVRNFRAVLHGVYYRGGANNVYNKNQKRANSNPLPKEGMTNLCRENFGTAFYFYSTNADQMQSNTICETNADKSKNNLSYLQISALTKGNEIEILKRIHRHIVNLETKPIYGHCWNGWHASGFIAALSLMQFCHHSNEKALAYWIKNTDGNNKGYTQIKKQISEFKRLPELEIEERQRKEICP